MARLGVTVAVVEKVLNHQSGSFGGIVSTYQKYQFEPEKRAALELWSAEVGRIVGAWPGKADRGSSLKPSSVSTLEPVLLQPLGCGS